MPAVPYFVYYRISSNTSWDSNTGGGSDIVVLIEAGP